MHSHRNYLFRACLLLASSCIFSYACSSDDVEPGEQTETGGSSGTGGKAAKGGSSGTGGNKATGGSSGTGGSSNRGGSSASGGSSNKGGGSSTGGSAGKGGGAKTDAGTGGAQTDGGKTDATVDSGTDSAVLDSGSADGTVDAATLEDGSDPTDGSASDASADASGGDAALPQGACVPQRTSDELSNSAQFAPNYCLRVKQGFGHYSCNVASTVQLLVNGTAATCTGQQLTAPTALSDGYVYFQFVVTGDAANNWGNLNWQQN